MVHMILVIGLIPFAVSMYFILVVCFACYIVVSLCNLSCVWALEPMFNFNLRILDTPHGNVSVKINRILKSKVTWGVSGLEARVKDEQNCTAWAQNSDFARISICNFESRW